MDDNKKTNYLTIILTILLIITVGVIGYFIGTNNSKENKLDNNEISEEDKQDNSNVDFENNNEESIVTPITYTPKCIDMAANQTTLMSDIDATKYNNIFEYIESQKNVKILINHCKSDENNINADSNGFVTGTYELTKSEKEVLINEMKNSTVEISKSGIGGACVSSLEIKYERNNKEYYVSYYQLFAMTSNDGNIYKIIDKSVNNTLDTPEQCLYNFNNLSNTGISILKRLTDN